MVDNNLHLRIRISVNFMRIDSNYVATVFCPFLRIFLALSNPWIYERLLFTLICAFVWSRNLGINLKLARGSCFNISENRSLDRAWGLGVWTNSLVFKRRLVWGCFMGYSFLWAWTSFLCFSCTSNFNFLLLFNKSDFTFLNSLADLDCEGNINCIISNEVGDCLSHVIYFWKFNQHWNVLIQSLVTHIIIPWYYRKATLRLKTVRSGRVINYDSVLHVTTYLGHVLDENSIYILAMFPKESFSTVSVRVH